MSAKSKVLVLFLMFGFVFVFAGISHLQAAEKVICPVSGKEIEKADATGSWEYKGKTYYFCCPNGEKQFKEDPAKLLAAEPGELHQHGEEEMNMEQEENATVLDPVCGMTVTKEGAEHTFEYNGKTYYFCSAGCKEKFMNNPEEYLKDAQEQVTCPVTGETIAKGDAAGSMEYKGKTYYFCCAGCIAKFKADPEKYIK